jgi:hypothetical protein
MYNPSCSAYSLTVTQHYKLPTRRRVSTTTDTIDIHVTRKKSPQEEEESLEVSTRVRALLVVSNNFNESNHYTASVSFGVDTMKTLRWHSW